MVGIDLWIWEIKAMTRVRTRKVNNVVHKREFETNLRAFYTPCSVHSVKLAVNDAASGLYSVDFFTAVQLVYNVFFSVF